MTENPLTVIRRLLQGYADRGIFRGFSEKKTKEGKNEFKFLWLTGQPMTLIYEGKNSTLRFKNLLLNVPSHSTMYLDLEAFVKGKVDGDLPKHRRIDSQLAEVECSNRGGKVSIVLKVKRGKYQYGVNKIVNLIHEIFLFLRSSWADYMWENVDATKE